MTIFALQTGIRGFEEANDRPAGAAKFPLAAVLIGLAAEKSKECHLCPVMDRQDRCKLFIIRLL